MPPNIFTDDSDGFVKPLEFLHPGIGKNTFKEHGYQPHIFQQSVTLTASMWNENDSKKNMEYWKFRNWGALGEYSPLFVGLVCGFGVVLIIMSTIMLWRYCLLSAAKKTCCRGTYGSMKCQAKQNSLPLRKAENVNALGNFKTGTQSISKYSALQRSVTVGSMPLNIPLGAMTEGESKFEKLRDQGFMKNQLYETTQLDPIAPRSVYTSHSYLQKESATDFSRGFSQSTPALEDLYAKVNFSKKRKNRMRNDDAAIIAMSKSHSGQNNSLSLTGSAIVVYNERTAL